MTLNALAGSNRTFMELKYNTYSTGIYYQLIFSIIRFKRQKSDGMDSDQIRKCEDLTYLTFYYTEIHDYDWYI